MISWLRIVCGIVLGSAVFSCEFEAADETCYGSQLKERYFLLANDLTNLNHGSFGSVPKPVAARQHEYFLEQEAYPDTWFRQSYYDYIDNSRAMVAKLIKASVDDVVLVENASSAVNSILRSMGLTKGDKVLRLSTAYGMVSETLNWLAETAGIEIIVVEVAFPVSNSNQIIDAVTQALQQHPDTKLCIFSHISSMPAVIEPVVELITIVRNLTTSATVLIDAAHAPGVLDLDVPSYGADFYLGNCHKWMYAPKGTAFLWVSSPQQHESFPEPTVISSSGQHDFVGKYAYTGTRDYTAFTSLPASFKFREFLGGNDQIYAYCHGLAVAAGRLLTAAWGTSLLVPEDLTGFMVNIILPSRNASAVQYMQEALNSTYGIYLVYGSVTQTGPIRAMTTGVDAIDDADTAHKNTTTVTTTAAAADATATPDASATAPGPVDDATTATHSTASSELRDVEDVVDVADVNSEGTDATIYFVRLSAQVYLELSDFERLASLVPELLNEGA